MTFELTSQKVFEHAALSLDIPCGTNLPAHVENYFVNIGRCSVTGPYVGFYPSDAHAMVDQQVIYIVHDRADFRIAYRMARVMRPGGRLNRGRA